MLSMPRESPSQTLQCNASRRLDQSGAVGYTSLVQMLHMNEYYPYMTKDYNPLPAASNLFPWLADPSLETALRSALGPDSCPIRRKREPRGEMPDEPFVFHDGRRWSAHYWRRHTLIEGPYANAPVYPRSPHILANWVPAADDNGGSVTLSEFVSMTQGTSIFDRGSNGRTLVEHLLSRDEWFVPEYLEGLKEPMEQRCMAAGPSRAGFPFHSHGETWQMQVIGKKLWLLHPPHSPDLPPSWEIAQPMALLEHTLLGGALAAMAWQRRCERGGAPKPPGPPAKMIARLLELGDLIYFPRLVARYAQRGRVDWHRRRADGDGPGARRATAARDLPSTRSGVARAACRSVARRRRSRRTGARTRCALRSRASCASLPRRCSPRSWSPSQ